MTWFHFGTVSFGGLMNKLLLSVLALSLLACAPALQPALTANEQTPQILGGEAVLATDEISKSTVAVFDTFQGGTCTGTLLSKNIILTAAHCVQSGKGFLAVLFGLDLKSAAKFDASESLGHNRYLEAMEDLEKILQAIIDVTLPGDERQQKLFAAMDDYKNWGDIALIKIDQDAPAGYVPASLLEDGRYLQNGATITLAGYGITKPYSEQNPEAKDESILRKVDIKISNAVFSETEISFDQTEGRGACHGDSGGPAFIKIGDKLKLFGITSRGLKDPEDSCRQFSGYTYFPAYKTWVSETIAKWEKPATPGGSKD